MSLLFGALDVFHDSLVTVSDVLQYRSYRNSKYEDLKIHQMDWNTEPLWIWDSLQVVAWGNRQLEGKDLVFCSQVFSVFQLREQPNIA